MLTAIQVVWWIGLGAALVLTLAILAEVASVLRAIWNAATLARATAEAARQLARDLEVVPGLQALTEVRGPLGDRAADLRDAARAVRRALATVETEGRG